MNSNSQECVQVKKSVLWSVVLCLGADEEKNVVIVVHMAEQAAWDNGNAPVGKCRLETRVSWMNFLHCR
jgi:hypothetical protein